MAAGPGGDEERAGMVLSIYRRRRLGDVSHVLVYRNAAKVCLTGSRGRRSRVYISEGRYAHLFKYNPSRRAGKLQGVSSDLI